MGGVRLRSLTPAQEQRLAALRHVSRLLDSAFVVPGTQYRIGLDPIFGLVPILGDFASLLFTAALIWQARDLSIPRVAQLRMVLHAAIDALVGVIPFVGDLFDFAWKSNQRNMAILERHAYEHHPASAGDWAFVTFVLVLMLLIAAAPFVIALWLLSFLARVL